MPLHSTAFIWLILFDFFYFSFPIRAKKTQIFIFIVATFSGKEEKEKKTQRGILLTFLSIIMLLPGEDALDVRRVACIRSAWSLYCQQPRQATRKTGRLSFNPDNDCRLSIRPRLLLLRCSKTTHRTSFIITFSDTIQQSTRTRFHIKRDERRERNPFPIEMAFLIFIGLIQNICIDFPAISTGRRPIRDWNDAIFHRFTNVCISIIIS